MKESVEIIKDFITSLLIVGCILLILSVIFYDEIAIGKEIPKSDEFMISEEMQQELENSNLEDAEQVVVKYYINATDLKKYEKTNEYNKGKNNPFGISTSNEENETSDNNTSSTNNSTGNFYEDDGTK